MCLLVVTPVMLSHFESSKSTQYRHISVCLRWRVKIHWQRGRLLDFSPYPSSHLFSISFFSACCAAPVCPPVRGKLRKQELLECFLLFRVTSFNFVHLSFMCFSFDSYFSDKFSSNCLSVHVCVTHQLVRLSFVQEISSFLWVFSSQSFFFVHTINNDSDSICVSAIAVVICYCPFWSCD